MQVTIDGVSYAPACLASSRIGIAITTHNRPKVLKRALEQHMKHLPTGALVVVIDDGSIPSAVVSDGVQLLRHESSLGIVASKNDSLTCPTSKASASLATERRQRSKGSNDINSHLSRPRGRAG